MRAWTPDRTFGAAPCSCGDGLGRRAAHVVGAAPVGPPGGAALPIRNHREVRLAPGRPSACAAGAWFVHRPYSPSVPRASPPMPSVRLTGMMAAPSFRQPADSGAIRCSHWPLKLRSSGAARRPLRWREWAPNEQDSVNTRQPGGRVVFGVQSLGAILYPYGGEGYCLAPRRQRAFKYPAGQSDDGCEETCILDPGAHHSGRV